MSDDKKQNEEQNEEQNEHEDVGLYDTLASRVTEILEEGKKTMDEALKKARDEFSSAGDFSREQLDKATNFVKRDLSHMAKQAAKTGDSFKKAVDRHRVAAGMQSSLSRFLNLAAETLGEMAEKSEQVLEFKTGEVTSPGTLTCKDCGKDMHMTKTVRIPPCPKCHKTIFRKSY